MTQFATDGVAQEIPAHRQPSPIGTEQRHYHLEPVWLAPTGVCTAGVVVIAGTRGTYAFPADPDGEIADYLAAAEAPAGVSVTELLAVMGYRIHPAPLAADSAH